MDCQEKAAGINIVVEKGCAVKPGEFHFYPSQTFELFFFYSQTGQA